MPEPEPEPEPAIAVAVSIAAALVAVHETANMYMIVPTPDVGKISYAKSPLHLPA